MSTYAYIAVDPRGLETRGTIEVTDQNEALKRIKEMGLFPTRLIEPGPPRNSTAKATERLRAKPTQTRGFLLAGFRKRVKSSKLAVFTRQLATLVEAGMPLLRSLRILQEQEEDRAFKNLIGELSLSIENGGSLGEAVAAHPKVFSRLYVNMVKAGEVGGALEVTLRRLAEFLEKSQKLRARIKSALFYPCTVLLVAVAILTLLVVFVVPRFRMVFEGLLEGQPLPAFTLFIFGICETVKNHLFVVTAALGALALLGSFVLRTTAGRWAFDRLKLTMPVLGPIFRKMAISRFSRTLGTLMSNGVPILQGLSIVKETAGNVLIGDLISLVHENVKQGEPIAPTLKSSNLFPAMVAGMVDVGEQTGALPDMLMKIADAYDEEVDNATSAMTSLLEPIMIVFLAVVVGSIVIAMFLPILAVINFGGGGNPGEVLRM